MSLSKNFWEMAGVVVTILVVLVTFIYYVARYTQQIDYLEKDLTEYKRELRILDRKVGILIGIVQKEYPHINVTSYVEIATEKGIDPNAAVEGLSTVQKSDMKAATKFLTNNMGFTKTQATAVVAVPLMKKEIIPAADTLKKNKR